MTQETAHEPANAGDPTMGADEQAMRRVVGLVMRAAERGETDALLESVEDPASRVFLSELASYATQARIVVPRSLESSEMDALHPTSAELQLEEELEEELTLADPIETELLVWLSQRQEGGAASIWERTQVLLADDEGESG
ncbi:MAG: hypothetical protein AB8I08_28935 [Sandaracinaceae bacterium]